MQCQVNSPNPNSTFYVGTQSYTHSSKYRSCLGNTCNASLHMDDLRQLSSKPYTDNCPAATCRIDSNGDDGETGKQKKSKTSFSRTGSKKAMGSTLLEISPRFWAHVSAMAVLVQDSYYSQRRERTSDVATHAAKTNTPQRRHGLQVYYVVGPVLWRPTVLPTLYSAQ